MTAEVYTEFIIAHIFHLIAFCCFLLLILYFLCQLNDSQAGSDIRKKAKNCNKISRAVVGIFIRLEGK